LEHYEGGIEVSAQTPLLSNLNMIENIALIRSVHHKLPQEEALAQAREALRVIGLDSICHNRVHQCQPIELLYVMVVRALMHDASNILIVTPYSFVKKLCEFELILDTLQKLQFQQNIIIVDIEKNIHHYRNCQCNILR